MLDVCVIKEGGLRCVTTATSLVILGDGAPSPLVLNAGIPGPPLLLDPILKVPDCPVRVIHFIFDIKVFSPELMNSLLESLDLRKHLRILNLTFTANALDTSHARLPVLL